MPAKRKLLDDVRNLIRLTRQSQDGLPRIRIRSLYVIPLSLSLPRHSSLHSITQHIDPHASIDDWLTLQPGSHLANHIVTALCAFYSASSSSPVPCLPSLMTWNPSSLKTIHTQTSPKLSHILKLSRTHICFLQETQWTSLQYNHLHLQAPFCTVLHAPCIDQHSSGIATFLPRPFSSVSHSIIEAGFILSVVTTISGVGCELINVYLHPDKVVVLGQKLLDHLLTPHSRQHPIRIIGGDFNHLQSKSPSLFTSLLQELNCSTPSPIPSFRRPDGYSSSLDFFLTQVPSHAHHLYQSKSFSYWPSYQPTGHGIHICKFITVPPITRSDDDLPAQAIPSSVFYQPPSQLVRPSSPLSSPSLQPLIRSLLSLSPHLPCYQLKPPFGPGGAVRKSLPSIALVNTITIRFLNYSLQPNPHYCLRRLVPGTGFFPIFLTLSHLLYPLFTTLMSSFPSTFFLLLSQDVTF